jgi:DNA-binding transcriptional LysR family regulator
MSCCTVIVIAPDPAMEISLDAQLFERLPREARLTHAGKVFEKEANKALEHSRRAVS